jgi:hypothetical protein
LSIWWLLVEVVVDYHMVVEVVLVGSEQALRTQ